MIFDDFWWVLLQEWRGHWTYAVRPVVCVHWGTWRLKWFRSLQRPAWCRMDTTCSTEWSKFHWTVRWWHKELWMQCSWGHRCMAQARVCSCISIWPPDLHLKSMPQNPVFECMQYESISYPSYAKPLNPQVGRHQHPAWPLRQVGPTCFVAPEGKQRPMGHESGLGKTGWRRSSHGVFPGACSIFFGDFRSVFCAVNWSNWRQLWWGHRIPVPASQEFCWRFRSSGSLVTANLFSEYSEFNRLEFYPLLMCRFPMVSPHTHSFHFFSTYLIWGFIPPTDLAVTSTLWLARKRRPCERCTWYIQIYPVYSNVLAVDVQKIALIDNLVPAVTSFSQKCCSIDKSRFRGACRRQAVGIKFRIRAICKSLWFDCSLFARP